MRPDRGLYVVAQTKSPELFEDAKAEVTFYMRRVRNLKPEDPNTFGVEAIEQIISQFKKIATGITAGAAGIVAISLLVGGIGIMNIMLVSVSERTREIGLRKALGARRRDIMWQVLTESVTLSTFGGLTGIAIGAAVGQLISTLTPLPARLEPWSVILGIGITATVGLFFGLYPASRAARLDPIEALRRE
jgi:putative ABC transport system permease protein